MKLAWLLRFTVLAWQACWDYRVTHLKTCTPCWYVHSSVHVVYANIPPLYKVERKIGCGVLCNLCKASQRRLLTLGLCMHNLQGLHALQDSSMYVE